MMAKKITKQSLMVAVTIAAALSLCSCVSMKSYRETKAQMLWNELELAHRQATIDSLSTVNATLIKQSKAFDSKMATKESELRELKSQKSRLEVENTLMRSELNMSETK
ncbi:MAG: hypothetical protein R3Y49_04855 [Rikenellaceae bacterium]